MRRHAFEFGPFESKTEFAYARNEVKLQDMTTMRAYHEVAFIVVRKAIEGMVKAGMVDEAEKVVKCLD